MIKCGRIQIFGEKKRRKKRVGAANDFAADETAKMIQFLIVKTLTILWVNVDKNNCS